MINPDPPDHEVALLTHNLNVALMTILHLYVKTEIILSYAGIENEIYPGEATKQFMSTFQLKDIHSLYAKIKTICKVTSVSDLISLMLLNFLSPGSVGRVLDAPSQLVIFQNHLINGQLVLKQISLPPGIHLLWIVKLCCCLYLFLP